MENQENQRVFKLEYKDSKWLFTSPDEKTISVRNSRQINVLGMLLLNAGVEVSQDDIEEASKMGPFPVRHAVHQEDSIGSCGESDSHEDSWKSELDPDLRQHVHGLQTRHFGPVGDRRMVAEIDRRMKALDTSIAILKAKGKLKNVRQLEEERTALRKARDWYVNPITGASRLAFSEADCKRQKKCRMWVLRAIRALASDLSMASAHLNTYVDRGARFVYNACPGWKLIVTTGYERGIPSRKDNLKKHAPSVAA